MSKKGEEYKDLAIIAVMGAHHIVSMLRRAYPPFHQAPDLKYSLKILDYAEKVAIGSVYVIEQSKDYYVRRYHSKIFGSGPPPPWISEEKIVELAEQDCVELCEEYLNTWFYTLSKKWDDLEKFEKELNIKEEEVKKREEELKKKEEYLKDKLQNCDCGEKK